MIFKFSAPATDTYLAAEFAVWIAEEHDRLQGAVVITPGSNEDGRTEIFNLDWQLFARSNRVALIGCKFIDIPHPINFIEKYIRAARGTGDALIMALNAFAELSRHPELATVPLLLAGMSAGGEFNYEFVAWKPERVLAFVVNKGGTYYSALLKPAARQVPGLFFVGERDLIFRTAILKGLFAVNRRAGALWALAPEPEIAHEVGSSLTMTRIFFGDIIQLWSAARQMHRSAIFQEQNGYVCDLETHEIVRANRTAPTDRLTSWVPSKAVAEVWQQVVACQL